MHSEEPLAVRIVTHNIRYATPNPSEGEELWSVRKRGLINDLRFDTTYNAESFICLQEVLHTQLLDIHSGLNDRLEAARAKTNAEEWSYIGVGRDDGREAGEYSPIFFRLSRWDLLEWETVWLSKTPSKPSKDWDAASIRILTIGVFKHKESKKIVVAMNTHLDDQGGESRLEAAKIILQQIDRYTKGKWDARVAGVYLAGDLNSRPEGRAYKLLNSPQSSLTDLRSLVPPDRRYGHLHTFSGFGNVDGHRIDFLHLGPLSPTGTDASSADAGKPSLPWKAQGYGVLENRFDDGIYVSDHRAVVGDVVLT